MADYDIFREQLAIKYPSYGHALWGPSPTNPDRPVQVGDVGFVRRGKFHRLFNALLPADDPSHERGVPEYHEPLVPTLSDHLDSDSLGRNDYCSAGVSMEADPFHYAGPAYFPKVSFQHKRTRGAAVLSLPVTARHEDTLARDDFKRWIVKHIDSWFAFAQKLGLGIEHMEEIILVTGCDLTKSWINVAFLENQVDANPAEASFGVNVEGPDTIDFHFSPGNARGAVLRHGPQGTDLPENQCVFIRGFRAARSVRILPRRLKAAAGPSRDPGGHDCDSDTKVMSILANTKYRDPLHLLLDYLAEASDCDMVVAHDDDLVTIDRLGHYSSLESLEPGMMMDLLRRSNIEIQKILCDLSSTDGGPDTDTSAVKVAMLSTKLQNWNIVSQSQWSPLAARNVDLGYTSESRMSSPPAVPGSSASTIRGDTSKRETSLVADNGDSVPSTPQGLADRTLDGPGHAAAEDVLLALSEIRRSISNVWPSLSEFAHVERDKLLTAVAVTFCVVSILGWVFSFTWGVIFKLFFTLVLASFPLSIWFEREYRHRQERRHRLDDRYERLEARMEALHHHVASLQLNPAVPAAVADERYNLPIMARATSVNPDILGQSGVEDDASQPAVAPTEDLASEDEGALVLPSPPAPHVLVELPTKPLEKEPLRIDTPLPSLEHQRKCSGPPNLQATVDTNIAPPLPSALATSRYIDDIDLITYPQGIKRPSFELNVNTEKGKFRYDRDFLLQFMNICMERPDNLPPLDVMGLKPTRREKSYMMSRDGSGHNHAINTNITPWPLPSALATAHFIEDIDLITYPQGIKRPSFELNVNTEKGKFRYDRDFLLQFMNICKEKQDNLPPLGVIGLEPSRISRTSADDSNRASVASNASLAMPVPAMGPPLEPVAPPEVSTNPWVETSTRRNGPSVDGESPEIIERKVKGLLNKLTMERFDTISDQIIAWANKSKREKDGRTLKQVIKLVLEIATDEETYSEMYAHLCRKMMEKICSKVQDDGITNAEGKPFAGSQLFRKYLLNRCQEDFERGWAAKETTAAATATKPTEDQAIKKKKKKKKPAAKEKTKGGETSELYSDEYFAAAKAKRHGLARIHFIGELFKMQMLTERIMHECIKKLLANVKSPDDEEVKCLCKLLTQVGSILDTQTARPHFDMYFLCMRELMKNKNINTRITFLLQDVIELRERKWAPRNAVATPTMTPSMIAQAHELAPHERQAEENDAYMLQNASMSPSVDLAASTPSGPTALPRSPRAGAPSDPIAKRRRLQLLPRSTPVGEEPKVSTPAVYEGGLDDEAAGGTGAPTSATTPEAAAKAKIEEDTKEFFSIRMLDEAESYFSSLPTEHRHALVDTLVMKSIEMKELDVILVSDLFVRVREKELCSPGIFEDGFNGLAELLDDLAVDIPKAWPYFAILLRGSGLDQDEERRGRIAEKTMDPDKLNRLL